MSLDPLTAILNTGGKIIDKIFPDKNEAAKAKLALLELQQNGELKELEAETKLLLGQTEVNKIEASSTRWWQAGWRPFIGWICGLSLAYTFVLQPFLIFIAVSLGKNDIASHLPQIAFTELAPVLIGMLGLSYNRTQEKRDMISGKKVR